MSRLPWFCNFFTYNMKFKVRIKEKVLLMPTITMTQIADLPNKRIGDGKRIITFLQKTRSI